MSFTPGGFFRGGMKGIKEIVMSLDEKERNLPIINRALKQEGARFWSMN